MAEGAAHLVDGVLPRVPVRQWVLSLPFELRFLLAWDRVLLTAVLRVVMKVMLGFQRRRAREELDVRGDCGAVTVTQGFGSALNVNVHVHAIVLDGVHVVEGDGAPRFHVLPAPSGAQRRELTQAIARRVRGLLERRGLLAEDGESEAAGPTPEGMLATCQAASVRGVVALGERSGRPVRRIKLPSLERGAVEESGRGVAGFDLDIGSAIPAGERPRLERLARYILRPPLASERLKELPGGNLLLELRRPWKDGTVAVELGPLDFLSRLAALVPPPRRHQLRYHGTLAPNARLRSRIVPTPPPGRGCRPASREHATDAETSASGTKRRRASASWRLTWAELIQRVWAQDVLTCARCGGKARIIAMIDDLEAARAILAHLGLPARAPPLAPAREPLEARLPLDW